MIGIILIVLVANYSIHSSKVDSTYIKYEQTAVIIDQLSQTLPNESFIAQATSLLKTANYTVDYIPSEQVTVDFYETLPRKNYDIIILRVHSTIGIVSDNPVFLLFTSEPYNQEKYQYRQLTDKVGHVKMSENSKSYFGIFPDFVKYEMKGTFDNSIILMMGCGGTMYPDMYHSFFKRGAFAYIGWNDRVDIKHTDSATLCILQHVLVENETLEQATNIANNEIGPDPTYHSTLQYYDTEI